MKTTCKIDEGRIFWFPQIAVSQNGELIAQSKTKAWVNVPSKDGKTIHMYSRDGSEVTSDDKWDIPHVTFAREKGHGYKYVGTFMVDRSCSNLHDVTFRRIRSEELI